MTTPENQIELFSQAVDALGGTRSAARALGCSEKTVSRLTSGQVKLHEGFLKDIAAALLEHADRCRKLERHLSPAFPSNLVEGQAQQDGRRTRHQEG
ncbi:hypothetical protein [Novosphingobium guangzhouense]|uniref:HTH cro/C1-type domain-containing protein n=1 Tax=Novosphingobium guangzhouense TaxID=1850347 RepID=A0A2K2G467_9SPHN|nr:hypothetical protein [Novosphingobium guangzhouense]PNU05839.1 hypothetical protein A8V01_14840 [Novosphingobium guangzhouense]